MTEWESKPALEAVEGVVKWFDPRKGYGFIPAPDGRDVFVHYSVIQGEGFRVLKDGAAVTYDAVRTEKGWKATRVIRNESVQVKPPGKSSGTHNSPRR
jgi:CspA family cold shock protein